MIFFKAHYSQWTFIYNFFPFYHGDDICDSLAAIGKKAIKCWEKDKRLVLSCDQLIRALCSVHNFVVSSIDISSFLSGCPPILTLSGCCKHYYTYHFPYLGIILAYEANDIPQYTPTCTFNLMHKATTSIDIFSFLFY